MHRSLTLSAFSPLLLLALATDALPAQKEVAGKAGRSFVTYSQVEWGNAAREEGKSGELRDAKFKQAFPDGLTIGADKKGGMSHTFKSGKELAQFLPSEGPCGVMTSATSCPVLSP